MPASSTRRRMISKDCAIVRSSVAIFSASESVIIRLSPLEVIRISSVNPPESDATGRANLRTISIALTIASGFPIRTCNSPGAPSC